MRPIPPALASPLARLDAAWSRLAPRERRLLALAALLLTGAALYALIDWSLSERARLARALPQARADYQRMQRDAAELAALRASAPRQAGADPLAAARAAATADGLALELSAVPEGIQARGTAPAAALLAWIAGLHEALGLRPVRVELRPAGEALEIDAVFAGAAS